MAISGTPGDGLPSHLAGELYCRDLRPGRAPGHGRFVRRLAGFSFLAEHLFWFRGTFLQAPSRFIAERGKLHFPR
jgi:hypothetical protein